MKRSRAVIFLLLALGMVLALSATLIPGATGGPATYARLQPVHAPAALEVWRDAKGRLTFHWVGDNPGEVDRYDPSTLALAEFSGGKALGSTTFQSSGSAWSHIHALYGVGEAQVASALAAGTNSAEPVDYAVAAPPHEGDYGRNVAELAAATGLAVPRLTSLDGYPLMDASAGPGGLAGLAFGPHPLGDSVIEIDLAAVEPRHPKAAGTVYRSMFRNTSRWPHRRGPVVYSDVGAGQIVFPYRSEWIAVTLHRTATQRTWNRIVRAILAAPPAG